VQPSIPPGLEGAWTIHRLRFRPDPADPVRLQPISGADAAFGPTPDPAPGLTPELVERIGRLVGCGVRGDGPTLVFSHLPEGGSVLCRTVAVPDRHGRGEGELEVAVVVLTSAASGAAGWFPIDAWPAEAWAPARGGGLGGGLAPRARTDLEDLIDFAGGVRELLPSVLADLRSPFADGAGPQILLVQRRPDDVARWISLCCASLPPGHAGHLTFATFAERPYDAYQQVVGITPEAEFAFSDEELAFTYRVRAGSGRRSPAAEDPWAAIAAALWQAGRPDLITDESLVPAGDPFDAGRLAVVALVGGVQVGSAAELLAIEWVSRAANTSLLAQGTNDTLLEALPRIARAAGAAVDVSRAAGPGAPVLAAVARAFGSLRRRATADAADPIAVELGRIVIRAALEDCARVTADPLADLFLTPYQRNRLTTEFGETVLAHFGSGGVFAPARLRGAFVLARALALDLDVALGPVAWRLGDLLLAPETGADRRTVLEFLDDPGHRKLVGLVLAHLEERILGGDAAEAAELASGAEGGAWLRGHEPALMPALRLMTAAAGSHVERLRGYQKFEALWTNTTLRTPATRRGERLLRIMWDLSWPDCDTLPLADAVDLGRLLSATELRSCELHLRLAEAFDFHVRVDGDDRHYDDLTDLAFVLHDRGVWLRSGLAATAELLRDLSDSSENKLSLRRIASVVDSRYHDDDVPSGVRDHALKEVATRYATASGADLQQPETVAALMRCCDGELLGRYAEAHARTSARDKLGRALLDSPEYAAGRFYLWYSLAAGADEDAERTGRLLLNRFILPAMQTGSRGWLSDVSRHLRAHEDMQRRWKQVYEHATARSSGHEVPHHQRTDAVRPSPPRGGEGPSKHEAYEHGERPSPPAGSGAHSEQEADR
jgi:hypothetical protein